MRRKLLLLAMLSLGALAPGAPQARMHDPEKMPLTRVRDLHYGDVLFYFYQDEDFEALTRLSAYEHWGRLPHHEAEAQLLAGGLYLSLGMHNEAGERFGTLLNEDVPTGVRNRAWFYLAQVWYARAYLERAEQALRKVNGRMSPELEARKEHLFANVLMYQGKYDEAIRLLAAERGPTQGIQGWAAYARFNLGVALVREQRLADADPFLTAVGSMYAESGEMLALKDRANLALGFAYLQSKEPEKARTALARVRLEGPYSNKALLGMGWADAALGHYEQALTPWTELRHRNVLDAAVQESFLAVPYAYSKLNANAQSAEFYETAVESFGSESKRIDAAVERIRSGALLDDVLAHDADARYGWFWQLKEVPDAPESRYLYAVLAGHDFQEGLKNYRDLAYMDRRLGRWGDNMEAFEDMVDTRRRAYLERLPRADALLASGAVDHLEQQRTGLENRVNIIDKDHDVAALGSAEEREQWARVQRLEAALAARPAGDDDAELRGKLRLIKGVLYYRLNDAFRARLWQQRRAIKDLDLALHETRSRWIRVERARHSMPTNTDEFAARISALRERIASLQTRLAAMEQKQKAYLASVAIGELAQQKDRLATYEVQARFALASMYDRAASPPTPAAAAAPIDEPPESGAPADAAPAPQNTPQNGTQNAPEPVTTPGAEPAAPDAQASAPGVQPPPADAQPGTPAPAPAAGPEAR